MTFSSSDNQNISHYREVIVECEEAIFELFSTYLFEAGATGIEELDQDSKLILKIYFPSQIKKPDELVFKIARLLSSLDKINLISNIKKKNLPWQQNWKKFFNPIQINQQVRIRPAWLKPLENMREIVIDPGMGFGTGNHESTFLCLKMMSWLFERQTFKRIIDIGTGSGILTIMALLYDNQRAIAIDIDEDSVMDAKKNLALSNIDPGRYQLSCLDIKDLHETGDLVVANIIAETLIEIADDLKSLVQPKGYLILSGVTLKMEKPLLSTFQGCFKKIKRKKKKDWLCFLMRKI
ncbi:MAG: 50S ribosomal protein L11 methyltransferase [Deltaproteobacteria bacterium]|nr:50S ribosomal protein L11 methyltransferase [Deltaproteobacteria bacterium]